MAHYQVMRWKHIPAQVKAWDGEGETRVEAKCMLPDRFQAAIDAFAMKSGSTEMDAYLEGWAWGLPEEREGTPEEVVAAVAAEFDAEMTRERLMNPGQAGPE